MAGLGLGGGVVGATPLCIGSIKWKGQTGGAAARAEPGDSGEAGVNREVDSQSRWPALSGGWLTGTRGVTCGSAEKGGCPARQGACLAPELLY